MGPANLAHAWPPTHSSLPSFIDFGHILGEISDAKTAIIGVMGQIRARGLIFRITVTGNRRQPRRTRELGACVPTRATHSSLPNFYRFRGPYSGR
ncbi:hypothetical protein DPMN_075167 [Dreissena polymorpha]|uniref:Uncharacterized protein n=1 Tax=Dreissena polymorpha TaxID=45954 RepID=A0A9D3YKK5_DREPO|nr:hypothetical protein DPMN_075167 [Dreissena polymorpha]